MRVAVWVYLAAVSCAGGGTHSAWGQCRTLCIRVQEHVAAACQCEDSVDDARH